jgi:hypothetical protein
MGIINKIQYLKAFFRMLPLGLISLYVGINGFINETKLSRFNKITGKIIYCNTKRIYSKISRTRDDAFVIQVVDNNFDTITCHTFVTTFRRKLRNLEGFSGRKISIWYDTELENSIKQIEYNQQLLIKYSAPILVHFFFTLLGGVYTILTIMYLVKYPEHLFGSNKKKILK